MLRISELYQRTFLHTLSWFFPLKNMCDSKYKDQIIRKKKPHLQQPVKRALFCVLYSHYMFQPSQEAIFRWLLVNTSIIKVTIRYGGSIRLNGSIVTNGDLLDVFCVYK
jgi:hypothetical protein